MDYYCRLILTTFLFSHSSPLIVFIYLFFFPTPPPNIHMYMYVRGEWFQPPRWRPELTGELGKKPPQVEVGQV